MSVRLTQDELDEFLAYGHTLIFTTVRHSGEPFATPMWYVYRDGAFFIRTMERSAKVRHIRRDSRVCCTVETGEAWVDLKAVIANCKAEVLDDEATLAWVSQELDRKYEGFRRPSSGLPEVTQRHYAADRVVVKATPRPGEIRSWYNRKIRTDI